MTFQLHRSARHLARLLLVALAIVFMAAGPAAARNVPGSASIAQTAVDNAMGSSILDSMLSFAPIPLCDYLDKPEDEGWKEPCTTGLSIGGGMLSLQDAPNGYQFDYTAAYSTMILTQRLNTTATIFGGLIGEAGSGILIYNDGTLAHLGGGPVAGATFDLNDSTQLTLLGAAEWLHYSTTRSNGLYTGAYDAGRFLADIRLGGVMEGDWFFLEYNGDLRLIHQENRGYTEFSGGTASSVITATNFTTLSAIGNLKLGVPMGGSVTPYVEATGYLGLFQAGTTTAFDDTLTGRLGVGLNAEVLSGTLSVRSGAHFDTGGYTGFDAGLSFTKPL
jgi:hypothetical protein